MIKEIKGRITIASLTTLKEKKINAIRALKRQKERKKTAHERFKTNQWFDVDEGSFYSHLNNIIISTEANHHPQYTGKEKPTSTNQDATPATITTREEFEGILETNVGECKRMEEHSRHCNVNRHKYQATTPKYKTYRSQKLHEQVEELSCRLCSEKQETVSHVQPFASSLSLYLPELWRESKDHNMLQCAIVSTVTHLVEGLGALSQDMYSFLLPLIHLSTDITQPQHVYLMEDGLDLWHNVLMNASRITPELLHLFVNMPALLDFGSENLRMCFAIIESYALLDEKEFLQTFSAPVVNACLSMLGNIKPEGGIILSRVVETVIKVSPVRGTELFAPALLKILHMILEVEEYTHLLVIYLCIVGEVILRNYAAFVHIIERVALQLNKQTIDVLGQLLDVWLDKLSIGLKIGR
ncbi:importin-11-like [Montipora foliosa]|uniref:importin-11-like n=1 Tax=Montipora foliosa TaxID=591990 RepID=UPI0035F12F4C